MSAATVLALNLDDPGHYLHVGPVTIGLANLLVVALMLAVFLVALLLPFPRDKR